MFRSTFNAGGLRSDCCRGGFELGVEFGRRGVDNLLSAARSSCGLIVAQAASSGCCGSRSGSRLAICVRVRGNCCLRGDTVLFAIATVAFLTLRQTQYLHSTDNGVQHATVREREYVKGKKDYLVMFTELHVSLE